MDPENDTNDEVRQEPQAPQVDLSPIEARLNKITQAISGITQENEKREFNSRVQEAERQINQNFRLAEAEVEKAEKALATAYDDGDGATIARRQRALTEAIAARESVRADQQEFERVRKDMEKRQGGSSGAPGAERQADAGQKDTRNLNDWKSKNSSWYGVDADMTKAAHEIDRTIREAGVIPVGSQEYFKAIDRQMAQRYPDRFRSAPDTAGGSQRAGNAAPRAGRIPNEVLDAWKRMGISTDTDEDLKRMIKNRETLVKKGILPAEPAYGPVKTR